MIIHALIYVAYHYNYSCVEEDGKLKENDNGLDMGSGRETNVMIQLGPIGYDFARMSKTLGVP